MSSGAVYATLAYLAWGFFPLYWKALLGVPAITILAHRIVWSFVFVAGLVAAERRWSEALAALREGRVLLRLCLSTALIACNWFVYIWAVNTERVLEASFGYFVTPLVNVVLGMVLLGERLRRGQWVAVALAGLGVGWLGLSFGGVPWMSLLLALSFGLYGLVRKTARVDALIGLLLETLLLLPFASAFLLAARDAARSGHDGSALQIALLLGSGVVTALPLLWFAHAARRLPLTVLGFFQYLAPTVQFLLGAFWFGEPLPAHRLIAFGAIWAALLWFSVEAALQALSDDEALEV